MVYTDNRTLCKYFLKCRNSLCVNMERYLRHMKFKKSIIQNMNNILTSVQTKEGGNIYLDC